MINKTELKMNAHKFTAILIIIQPIMDIISFWFDKFGISSNITLVLRLGVLAVTVLYAYIITDKKHIYWITFSIIALVYAGHLFAIWQGGIVNIFTDFANFVRVVQMPISAICLMTFLRMNKRSFDGLQYGMTVALIIMLSVMIISVITGTNPGMYADGDAYSKGILGWFNNTNSQSNNLCILVPVSIAWQLVSKKRNNFLLLTTIVLGLFAMFFACTRLAYLGIVAVTVGLGVVILIVKRTEWKYSLVMLAFAMIFVALIPVSPMTAHLNHSDSTQDVRQDGFEDKIDDFKEVNDLLDKKNNKKPSKNKNENDKGKNEDDGVLSKEELAKLVKQLSPAYEFYVSDFVQIFGIEETIEMYDYTTDIKTLAQVRNKKLKFAQETMERLPASAQIFGVEYGRFTVSHGKDGQPLRDSTDTKDVTVIYDVENDFHGIFYLYGWAGLAAYIIFILYFVYLVAWALIKNIKRYFTLNAAAFGIALILCLIHAYNTAGVLRRPNASLFLAAVLAGIYYLVRIKDYTSQIED